MKRSERVKLMFSVIAECLEQSGYIIYWSEDMISYSLDIGNFTIIDYCRVCPLQDQDKCEFCLGCRRSTPDSRLHMTEVRYNDAPNNQTYQIFNVASFRIQDWSNPKSSPTRTVNRIKEILGGEK